MADNGRGELVGQTRESGDLDTRYANLRITSYSIFIGIWGFLMR